MMPTNTLSEKLKDREAIIAAMKAGVREAVELHKMKKLPMVVSKAGKIVWIPPEDFYKDLNDQ